MQTGAQTSPHPYSYIQTGRQTPPHPHSYMQTGAQTSPHHTVTGNHHHTHNTLLVTLRNDIIRFVFSSVIARLSKKQNPCKGLTNCQRPSHFTSPVVRCLIIGDVFPKVLKGHSRRVTVTVTVRFPQIHDIHIYRSWLRARLVRLAYCLLEKKRTRAGQTIRAFFIQSDKS